MNSMKTTNAAGKVIVPLAVIAIAALFIGGAYAYSASYSDNFGQQDIEAVYVTISADSTDGYGYSATTEHRFDVDVVYDTLTVGSDTYYRLTPEKPEGTKNCVVMDDNFELKDKVSYEDQTVTFSGLLDVVTVYAHGDAAKVTVEVAKTGGAIDINGPCASPATKGSSSVKYSLVQLSDEESEGAISITVGEASMYAKPAYADAISPITIDSLAAEDKVYFALFIQITVDQLGDEYVVGENHSGFYNALGGHVANLSVSALNLTYTATAEQAVAQTP